MFKIMALMCVFAVNGQNLCLVGDIPSSKFNTKQDCLNAVMNIVNFTDEDFKNRNIGMEMQCVKLPESV
jgi:hypothetical protein